MDINFLDQILPTQIWAIATGLSLILVMLACGIYFWHRSRLKALVKDGEDAADLAARKVQLEAEIKHCQDWLDSNREELLRLDVERQEQERVRQDLANLEKQNAEIQQEVNDLRKETNDLQNVVTVLSQDHDRLVEEIKVLENEKAKAEKANQGMQAIIERYEEEKKKFDGLLQNMAQSEIKQQSLIGEISTREAQLSQVQKELKLAQEDLAKVKADIVPLKEVIAEKERERKNRDDLLEEIEKHKEVKNNLQGESKELEKIKGKLQREVDVLERKVIELRTEAGTVIDKADRYADIITKPNCLYGEFFPQGELEATEERKKINELMESLANQGLIFPERTINAFHTSLKINNISPLTVLAGISGTGKTLLPIKYAEAMGMHSLVVSIQPRWDSPQDLFGFYNYLEHKYKATDLARALIRMDSYNFEQLEGGERSDRMLLVLLDEMNLARVEYYFSEFLSKLELRRDIKDKTNAAERSRAEIELETGPRSVEDMVYRIWVGENVLFVGTVNEDESTQTLSDKVLDRANVLRFGKPPDDLNPARNNIVNSQERFLPFSEWKKWIKQSPGDNDWDADINKWIKSVNAALELIGRPFGHRVQQAMRLYVKNYPGVNDRNTHKYAFADQVEQKVIPKLRGIDLNEDRSRVCLDEIHNLVEELGDTELAIAFLSSKDDLSTGMFVWRGVTRHIDV